MKLLQTKLFNDHFSCPQHPIFNNYDVCYTCGCMTNEQEINDLYDKQHNNTVNLYDKLNNCSLNLWICLSSELSNNCNISVILDTKKNI